MFKTNSNVVSVRKTYLPFTNLAVGVVSRVAEAAVAVSSVHFMYVGYIISSIGTVFETSDYVDVDSASTRSVFITITPAFDRPGVIFGYRAHIANTNAMLVLHLWRPVPSSNQTEPDSKNPTVQLIDELYFSPTVPGLVEVSHAAHNNSS